MLKLGSRLNLPQKLRWSERFSLQEVRKDVSQLSEQVRQLEVAIKAERGGPRHMAEPLRVAAMAKPRLPEQHLAGDVDPIVSDASLRAVTGRDT